ncbi:MAG: hypothetical protein Q4G27_06580 [Flavobacteriaceae bacterium]|nr:hypothetical protein [Flavobacteriaceae bacterium]
MKKSILVLVLLMASMLNAGNDKPVDSARIADVLPTKMEHVMIQTDLFKIKWVVSQMKSEVKSLDKSIQYMKDLAPLITDFERKIRK